MNRSEAHESLVRACVALLRLNKIPAYAVNQVTRQRKDGSWHAAGAPKGFPDIVACMGGLFLAVECKTGKAVTSADQKRVHAELALAGAKVVVIRSVDELKPLIAKFRAGWWAGPKFYGPDDPIPVGGL